MLKELQEKRNALLDELDSLLAKAKEEKRAFVQEELDAIKGKKEEIRLLDESIQIEEEVRQLEPKKEVKPQVEQTKEEKRALEVEKEERAFVEFIKGDVRALDVASNGAVIPKSIANRIVDKVINISPLLSEVEIFRVKGDLVFPIYDFTTHTTSYATEFTDLTESGGTFTQVTLTNNIIGSLTKIGKSLINRGDIDVVSYIVNAIAKSISLFLETELIKGVGGAGKLKGLAQISAGQTVAGATTMVIDPSELTSFQMKLPQVYQGGAKWLMHPNTLAYLQGLKATTGQFLMGNTMAENGGYMLLGKPVMLSDQMPVMGANALEIYYGDFSGLYFKVTNDVELQVLNELYAKQYAVGVVAFAEVDSVIVEPQKLLAYKGK